MLTIGRSLRLWSPLERGRRKGERKEEEQKALRERENRRGGVPEDERKGINIIV